MQWNWLIPVLIVASISASYMFSTWVRAKHGYPLEDDNGKTIHRTGALEDSRKLELLEVENGKLKAQLLRLEDRVSVLERIATDRSRRLADEIDSL
jgi:hypothetical protein